MFISNRPRNLVNRSKKNSKAGYVTHKAMKVLPAIYIVNDDCLATSWAMFQCREDMQC